MTHSTLLEAEQESFIKLLNEYEVSMLIRKSVHWLRRKRWEGGSNSIPYRKLGGSVRYAESDVLNWIRQCSPRTSTNPENSVKVCPS